MNNIKEHISILGYNAKDKVTGFSGVITCVSFDLYGCVQAIVSPKANGDTIPDGRWFDVSRLDVETSGRVMAMPRFEDDMSEVSKGEKGPAEKPAGRV